MIDCYPQIWWVLDECLQRKPLDSIDLGEQWKFFHGSEVTWATHQAKVIHQNARQPSVNIQHAGNRILLHTAQRTHISRLRQQIRVRTLMNLCTSHTRQLGQINIGLQFISQINHHRTCLDLYHTWALLLHSTQRDNPLLNRENFDSSKLRTPRVKAPWTLHNTGHLYLLNKISGRAF